LAVTVIVDALDPLLAVIVPGAAATVEWLADTAAGFTVTLAVWVIPTPLIVAEMILASALVEVNVDVDTPLALVVVGGVKLPPDPEALSTTVKP
jgi:hypothetical protein